ncbi:MAG: hypothetical protein FWD30_03985 [Dehalococcoidia bacterium]|nr:hypothetical protein [Dehalococcoidia bacterium]
MTSIITIAAVFVGGLLCGAFVVWLNARLRRKQRAPVAQQVPVTQPDACVQAGQATYNAPVFRLRFVIAPIVLAALCLIAVVSFYASLGSPLAYRFDAAGEARNVMNKNAFVIIMVVAQAIGALIVWGLANIIIKMGHSAFKTSEPQFRLDGFITLMSNMILLPQLILAYVMLDAFIYSVWQRHFIPATSFTIGAIIIGSGIIFVAFVLLLTRARRAFNKQ